MADEARQLCQTMCPPRVREHDTGQMFNEAFSRAVNVAATPAAQFEGQRNRVALHGQILQPTATTGFPIATERAATRASCTVSAARPRDPFCSLVLPTKRIHTKIKVPFDFHGFHLTLGRHRYG